MYYLTQRMNDFTKRLTSFLLLCGIIIGTHCILNVQASPITYALQPGDALPADLFIKLAKVVNPTVVNIATTQFIKYPVSIPFNDPFFEFFFSPYMTPPQAKPLQALGTGFVIRSNGLIVTNTHVVNKADSIKVQLMGSDKLHTATLIGQDIYTDIALLKIDVKKPLLVAQLGNSHQLQVGEWVAAFGNPYGHSHTMTKGIISAINRQIDELNLFPFLQTDASINPGNSGGPLVNTKGEVIGINTAMRSHGISFAIPIDNVKVVLKDLEQYGRVRRGFIGVHIEEQLDPKKKGALIVEVAPGMSAEKAGVQVQDIITKFNNKKINTYTDLFKAVAATPINTTVPIEILRKGQKLDLSIKVMENKSAKKKKVVASKEQSLLNLGLSVTTGTKDLLSSLNLPLISRTHPVIVKVHRGGLGDRAGFQKKDIILKINGRKVSSANEARKLLLRNRTNLFNILRYRPHSGQYIALLIQIKVH